MIQKHEIDSWIEELLEFLQTTQNNDGSFNTMYLQPYYNPEKGWMHYAGNSPYETAFPLTVLEHLQSEKAKAIISKGTEYITKTSLDNFLWTYAYPSKKDLVPYDTDSTSLCSIVLEKQGYTIKNKHFLNGLIDEKGYYPFYIWPSKKDKHIPLFTYIKLKRWNNRTKNSTNITNRILELDDSEFTSTCINLLYLGKTEDNQKTWDIISKKVRNNDLDFLYYIDKYHALYHYARLAKYGNQPALLPEKEVLEDYIFQLESELDEITQSPRTILFFLFLLLFDQDVNKYEKRLEQLLHHIREHHYKETTAFYSSNRNTDYQPGNLQPQTYFGSPAVTCSLYLEFLFLYFKKYHDNNQNKKHDSTCGFSQIRLYFYPELL